MKEFKILKDLSLILLYLIAWCAVFVAFLWITNLIILLVIILAVVFALYLFNRAECIKSLVIGAFDRQRKFAFATIIAIILLLPVILRSSPYWIFILTLAILWIIVALGINIQFGSAGIINLGSAAFYGVGAYTAGMLATKLGIPPLLNFFLGAVILGGVDSIIGVSVAAVLLVIMPEKLRALQEYWVILFGIILVLMLILRRKGLIPARVRNYGLKISQAIRGPLEGSLKDLSK